MSTGPGVGPTLPQQPALLLQPLNLFCCQLWLFSHHPRVGQALLCPCDKEE